jgi:hypothetical protein
MSLQYLDPCFINGKERAPKRISISGTHKMKQRSDTLSYKRKNS